MTMRESRRTLFAYKYRPPLSGQSLPIEARAGQIQAPSLACNLTVELETMAEGTREKGNGELSFCWWL